VCAIILVLWFVSGMWPSFNVYPLPWIQKKLWHHKLLGYIFSPDQLHLGLPFYLEYWSIENLLGAGGFWGSCAAKFIWKGQFSSNFHFSITRVFYILHLTFGGTILRQNHIMAKGLASFLLHHLGWTSTYLLHLLEWDLLAAICSLGNLNSETNVGQFLEWGADIHRFSNEIWTHLFVISQNLQRIGFGSVRCVEGRAIRREVLSRLRLGEGRRWKALAPCFQRIGFGSVRCVKGHAIHREVLSRLRLGEGRKWKALAPCLQKIGFGNVRCVKGRAICREVLLRLQLGEGRGWKTLAPCLSKYTKS
jgi:hypothetical protein